MRLLDLLIAMLLLAVPDILHKAYSVRKCRQQWEALELGMPKCKIWDCPAFGHCPIARGLDYDEE